MKEGEYLSNLPPEEKKRLAYIEGRPDLFRTKFIEFVSDENEEPVKENILVEARDPGGANALSPVLELLKKDENIGIKAIVDGRAQEIFQGKFNTKDITPEDNILRAAELAGSPDAALVAISDEAGVEMFASATFPEVPSVLVEDYYGSSLGYLRKLKERDLIMPKKICVIDKEAKKLILDRFPELEGAVEVTGQPAFDRFANENTNQIESETKAELGIAPEEKLVTFMSAIDRMDLVQRVAEELEKVKGKFKFTFRIHPRDNTPLEEFEREFKSRGIDYVETMHIPTDRIGATSDLVITTTSTEGLHAICRGKPSINITDPRFVDQIEYLSPPPSVKLGASEGVENVDELADCVEELLNPKSEKSESLRERMEANYPQDGNNSKRVVKILKQVLKSK